MSVARTSHRRIVVGSEGDMSKIVRNPDGTFTMVKMKKRSKKRSK